ncbi:DUF106 domain-containing protein [Halovenus salina]|uniref:DUF106 domain-containing protein n=1 Tax=Halovenus salina TaxID=1510225 RepID=UPI002260AD7E|nr:DUF106 domain-containing protein [Halovenus salina]
MPIEQLEALLSDPGMREAIAVVFERSEGGADEIDWSDVSDELTSGEWGRLLDTGVLVGSGGGFALAEPEQVRDRLADHDAVEEATREDTDRQDPDESLLADFELPEVEPVSWSVYDKTAGGFALLLFTGYWSTDIRDAVASMENTAVDSLLGSVPFYLVILILAIATGLYSTALRLSLVDQNKLQQYRDRMQTLRDYRQRAKERGDDQALERLQEKQREAASDQLGMMKLQFRSTAWIMLLTIPIFLWLRWKVRGGHLGTDETGLVVPLAGEVSWQQALVGPMATWIVWYFACATASRQVIRKLAEWWTERRRNSAGQ